MKATAKVIGDRPRNTNGAPKEPPPGFYDDFDGQPQGEPPPPPPPPWESRVTPVPAAWYATKPAPRTWLLRDRRTTHQQGVLPVGKAGQIIAGGGLGKTMAECQIAVGVATGAPIFGALSVATRGRVLLVLGEEDSDECWRRIHRAAKASGTTPPGAGEIVVIPLAGLPAPMLQPDERGGIAEAAFLVWLRSYIAKHGPFVLIVIDPTSRFGGPEVETDNASATRFVQACESLVVGTSTNVLAAHHTNKVARAARGVSDGMGRGSSALFDGFRWECVLSKEDLTFEDPETRDRLGEIVTLSFTKSNYGRKAQPILLRRDIDNGGAFMPLDESDLALVEEARARTSGRESKEKARVVARKEGRAADVERLICLLRAKPGQTGLELEEDLNVSADRRRRLVVALGDAVKVHKDAGSSHALRHYLDEAALARRGA